MKNYRLYPLDEGGNFLGMVEFMAPDDLMAREIAERTTQGRPSELWEDARLIQKTRAAETAR